MALPRGLIEAVLKYRKRRQRPLGPTIPSYAGQCDFVRPVTRVPGDDYVVPLGSVAGPEVYMGDLPEDYMPDVGFMEIPQPDYGPYEASSVPAPFTPALRGFGGLAQDFEVVKVEYDDCLMTQELFEHEMRLATRFEPLSLDQVVELDASRDLIEKTLDFGDIAGRLLSPADMDRGISLPQPVIDARGVHVPAPAESLPGHVDYAAVDPRDFFEQQMQMMESQFSRLDPGAQMEAVFDAHEALFELSQRALPFEPAMPEPSVGGMAPGMMPGPASLDAIIEAHDLIEGVPSPGFGPDVPAYGDSPMTQELFEQQMHEAIGEMGPSEEGPAPYDGGMMQQDMYDQPVQDQMMDPYMMPGPMGPSFMPEPPPGP